MLDYQMWINRVIAFMKHIQCLSRCVGLELKLDPPQEVSEIEKLARQLRLGIPSDVCDFLSHGSGKFTFKYCWDVPLEKSKQATRLFGRKKIHILGGGSLCASEDFMCAQIGCYDHGGEEAIGSSQRDYWLNSFPFLPVGNGDYIAAYHGDNREVPKGTIVYLDHDGYDTGSVVSSCFDQFLLDWEASCYIDPLWIWDFLPPSDAAIKEKREFLRRLFGVDS